MTRVYTDTRQPSGFFEGGEDSCRSSAGNMYTSSPPKITRTSNSKGISAIRMQISDGQT